MLHGKYCNDFSKSGIVVHNNVVLLLSANVQT